MPEMIKEKEERTRGERSGHDVVVDWDLILTEIITWVETSLPTTRDEAPVLMIW